jgi:hypothetical protein
MKTLAQAILAALTDYSENGKLTPSNPAIVRDGDGYYYGSALHPHDGMVWDLQEGLDAWMPEPGDDLEAIADVVAEMVESEMSSAA